MKVRRVRAKRLGAVRLAHSEDVRRREQVLEMSRLERMFERMLSSRQSRTNAGLEVAIACTCRSGEFGGECEGLGESNRGNDDELQEVGTIEECLKWYYI